jgi:mutator protein MutT
MTLAPPETMLLSRVLIVNEHDQVLLALRSQQTFLPGMWELPGGKLDRGETWREAAIREVHEETSLHVDPFMKVMDHRDSFDGQPIRTAIYIARLEMHGPVRLRDREHEAYGWFDPSELPGELTSTAVAALEHMIAKTLMLAAAA